MKSFEADDDVARMLARAEQRGVKLVWLANNALRPFLIKMGYARKKDLSAKEAK